MKSSALKLILVFILKYNLKKFLKVLSYKSEINFCFKPYPNDKNLKINLKILLKTFLKT